MTQYRKKPIVIDAYHYEGWRLADRTTVFPQWLMTAVRDGSIVEHRINGQSFLSIKTLEGVMKAEEGDWVIKGVKGELYPCKPDIFAATYEEVV